MPRCFSISSQSEVAWRPLLRAFTVPAIWIAPPNSSSFSVSVVLPASGWEMMREGAAARHFARDHRVGYGDERIWRNTIIRLIRHINHHKTKGLQ